MGSPKTPWGTCKYCNGVVKWTPMYLSEEQEAENNAVAERNKAARARNDKKRQERMDAGDYSWHDDYEPYEDEPHRWPSPDPRWIHHPEERGEEKIYCPDQTEDIRRYQTRAKPKEFCCARTNEGDICNRTANFESKDGDPYCKTHFDPVQAREENDSRWTRNRELRDWAEAVSTHKEGELKALGLRNFKVSVYDTDINVTVSIGELIDWYERIVERVTADAKKRPSRAAG